MIGFGKSKSYCTVPTTCLTLATYSVGGGADAVSIPDDSDVQLTDFNNAAMPAAFGQESGEGALPEIRLSSMSMDPQQFPRWL